MVTSRDNEMDELLSLNYGADQYVTKPYNIQILLAKIVGLLKRNQNAGNNPDKIDCGSFILNTAGRIIEKEDKKIELTKNEYKILEYLVLHRQQVISRDEIMDYLWESEEFVDDNTLSGADGRWIYFDAVPEEYEIRDGGADYTGRICVIGQNLNEEKLEKLFKLA